MKDYHFFEDILMYLCDNIYILVQHNNYTYYNVYVNINVYRTIVGYVDHILSNAGTTSGHVYYKIVVNNRDGRRVQIIGWQEHVNKLEELNLVSDDVVKVQNARVKIPRNAAYNSGNVQFELQLEAQTRVTRLGSLTVPANDDNLLLISLMDAENFIEKGIQLCLHIK
ncbi:unnamed protein product [Trichogramma brassicae]|uniref:Uncharacterized protein n=1 Tax=Trichogramma brassicae TaxID=86971 RepID=A0A6H5HZ98_9HYME|nr:unnamed protein product [Trichogramma brassicae]